MPERTKKKDNKTKKRYDQKKLSFKGIFLWIKEKPLRWVGLILLVLVTAFFIFNSLRSGSDAEDEFQIVEVTRGDLVAIVGATGIIKANQTAELTWETTGRVANVYVDAGDQVEQGEILADLADNTLPQSVILALADLVAAEKELDDLLDSDTESAEAYRDVLEAEREKDNSEDDRDQWNYNNADWDRIYTARADYLKAEDELLASREIFRVVENLPDDNPERIIAEEKLEEAQFTRDKALRNLNYILGKSYSQQVAEDFADFDIASAQLEDARREWERVKDGPNAADIKAAEARVAAAEATVSLGWLEAPFLGTLTRAYPQVGDEVSAGTEGFRIDDLSELLVTVDVSEVDINRVKTGQRAELTFDAITGETYLGEVTEVSSVGVDIGGGVDFEVKLKVNDPDENVRPGMTAAVNIVVNEINDILIIPNRAIRLMEGQRVVYTLSDGKLNQVDIEIGASSDIQSEILSGDIKVGDVVVLNPPFMLQSNGRPPAFVR